MLITFLASCSGDERLSKEEFVRQADAVCDEFDDQVANLRPPTTPDGIRDFAEETQSLMTEALVELRELKPPAGDQETVDDMLGNLEKVTALLPELATAAEQQDLDAIRDLNGQFSTEVNEFNDAADAYGLKVCGSTTPGG